MPPLRDRDVLDVLPEALPGFCLLGRLGQGGCGQVWEAARADKSVVALKFLDCRHQPSVLVANEIRTLLKLRQLQHPNIIRLHDVVATRHHIVLVMDRADGNLQELEDACFKNTGQSIPGDQLLELFDQAAEGLDFMAQQRLPGMSSGRSGMQHCDVKPSNLLILQDTLKIADFGLCMTSHSATHRKRFIGTPPYAAPELYEGKVTAHTDQYALAVTWCELVAGRRVMLPPEIAELPGGCPVDFRKVRAVECPVLQRALDPHWTRRFPSCKSFVDALRQALSQPRDRSARFGSRQLQTLRMPS